MRVFISVYNPTTCAAAEDTQIVCAKEQHVPVADNTPIVCTMH